MKRTTATAHPGSAAFRPPSADVQALSRRGLTELFLFLLISTIFFACRHADLLAPLTESARQLLGCPPPTALTTLAVAGYTVSAAIRIVHRAAAGDRPVLHWSHLFFRTVFFLFYAFAGSLAAHFMAVFVAGLILFALDHLNLWTYALKQLPVAALSGKP